MIDDDFAWDTIRECAMLEVEGRVLAAEATVTGHVVAALRTERSITINPNGPLAEIVARQRRRTLSERRGFIDHPDKEWRRFCIECCCYGWRRDYGEWPSTMNLVDRVATDCGITHRTARKRITAMVNDPSDDAHLYLCRGERMDEILADEPMTVGPWDGSPQFMRLYITAEAMNDLMQRFYEERCWQMEGVA